MFSPISEKTARSIGFVLIGALVAGAAYVAATLWLLFGVERVATWPLFLAVLATLPGYYVLTSPGGERKSFRLGLALRIAAVFAFPILSDDVYRFLWDGALWWSGLHPFSMTPIAVAASVEGAAFAKTHAAWLANMNSAGYFTVYPPLSQAVFALAGGITSDAYWGSVLIKVFLLAGELGVWWLLPRLVANLENRRGIATLYWLNPLVIVEVMGNAHFEGLALFFLLLALYGLRRAGLGWARQGWVAVGQLRTPPSFGPNPPTYSALHVGPGLTAAEMADVHRMGSRRWYAWLLFASSALAAGALVKLVPLVAAPALTLTVLWAWSRRPVFGETFYAFVPKRWQARVRALADALVSRPTPEVAPLGSPEEILATTDPATLAPKDAYVLTGKWPYGHPYEVIPLSAAALRTKRTQLGQRLAREQARTPAEIAARDEAVAFATTQGGGPVVFPLLRGERRWHWWPAVGFGASALGLVCLAMAFLLLGSGIAGFGESLDLYFRKFEFNGSSYTLISAAGDWYKGYNWISVVGPGLSLAGAITILALSAVRSWRGLDLAETLLWCMAAYFACATTVHPWYFVYLIGLGALTRYRWPMLLGFTAFLSYAAYNTTEVAVPTWALLLEYVPVVAYGTWEVVTGLGGRRLRRWMSR